MFTLHETRKKKEIFYSQQTFYYSSLFSPLQNAFTERKYDRPLTAEEDDLTRISPEELLLLASKDSNSQFPSSPFREPIEKSSLSDLIYPLDSQEQLDKGLANENDEEILLLPLGRLLDVNDRMDRKPEIRVLRDTNEEERESAEQFDGGSDEITPKLNSQISPSEPSDDDVFMVDVIEKDDVKPGTKEDTEKEGKVFANLLFLTNLSNYQIS